jgi:ankyrin repeat protein
MCCTCDVPQDGNGNTAMHTAIQLEFDEAVDLMTDVGIQLNFQFLSEEGFTVLHQAARFNNYQ